MKQEQIPSAADILKEALIPIVEAFIDSLDTVFDYKIVIDKASYTGLDGAIWYTQSVPNMIKICLFKGCLEAEVMLTYDELSEKLEAKDAIVPALMFAVYEMTGEVC